MHTLNLLIRSLVLLPSKANGLNARLFLLAVLMAAGSQVAGAKDSSATAQLEAQIGSDLLSAKSSALESAVIHCIHENRKGYAQYAPTILKSGRADANAMAPFLVIASVQGLGKEITEREVTGIVYETVKATPDVVLEIVDAAARNVPLKMVPAVVSAAVNAVPDPYKIVPAVGRRPAGSYARTIARIADPSFKGKVDLKEIRGPKDEPYAPTGTEPLAQAIVDTAINASGATDPGDIIAAADPVLLLGSAVLTSPLGIEGASNYGNEPKPKPTPTPTPTPVVNPVSK